MTMNGSNELVHSFVSSGTLQLSDQLGQQKEEVVFPPQELEATASQYVGSAVIRNLEYMLGAPLETGLAKLSQRYHVLNLLCVGDAATANLKAVGLLFAYMQKLAMELEVDMTIIATFTNCFLHQLARLLALLLDHRSLTACMYSISKLHAHTATRDATRDSMKKLLQRRFHYSTDPPPECLVNTGKRRALLFSLLTGWWHGEADAEHVDLSADNGMVSRKQVVQDCLNFFNGNILDSGKWTHHCQGCHANRAEAFQHDPKLSPRNFLCAFGQIIPVYPFAVCFGYFLGAARCCFQVISSKI